METLDVSETTNNNDGLQQQRNENQTGSRKRRKSTTLCVSVKGSLKLTERKTMGKFGFAIDRGGTFTDVYVRRPDGSSRVLKLLSEDPSNYADAPTEGIRRILEQELQVKMPRSEPIDASQIEWIRMGTTVATNALLERKGEPTALAVTKGFRDLLYIGNQSRPKLFDLKIAMPDVLYKEIIEVNERVVLQRSDCQLNSKRPLASTTTECKVEIWKEIDENQLAKDLKLILDKGISSLAVLLLHSYMFPDHELIVEKVAKKVGFKNISLSSQIMPMIKAVPRGFTATADAYLTPVIQRYIRSFTSGFKHLEGTQVLFMQSDGGLSPVDTFYGSRAILSGPAGGVVGVALTAYDSESKKPIIGFDMGGTSTDVSRYAGEFDHVFETSTAGVTIQAPQLDVNTVAAGGGSRLFFRNGLFVVGPESAGADPGPVCYKKGGHLAVTDANLILGRILPDHFPHIFGPDENEPLDVDACKEAMQKLTDEINASSQKESRLSVEEVALGFVEVANESMCRPIRALTQAKGYDTSQHVLACFGGAGGQHACAIAKSLGMKTVFIHKYAGVLSAYGLALADVVNEAQEPSHTPYTSENFSRFDERLNYLIEKCKNELTKNGFTDKTMEFEPYLNMRYDRTDCALMCGVTNYPSKNGTTKHGDFLQSFLDSYKREFGFTIEDRKILVDDIRVRGVGKSCVSEKTSLQKSSDPAKELSVSSCYFKGGSKKTNVYRLKDLLAGHTVNGPAIIIEPNSTVVVEPDCTAVITDEGNVRIDVGSSGSDQLSTTVVDPIQLSIFSHRFMSIAEQMGRVLQRTAISTNIKERLDFSCALFAPDGGLIANAPHIPVHLGSMQETVMFQMKHLGKNMKNGDVILCNDPNAGGTHLPDLTVITPVYYDNSEKPVFFVANRGHHADIGGLVPGSMPPHSTKLEQEGACITSFKIVENGKFQEEGKVPGCSGTRNLNDNISDIRAQIAANQKGIHLVCELIDAYSLKVVQAYMGHIQANADSAVRQMIKEIGSAAKEKTGKSELNFLDHMDDGTPLQLTVAINPDKGEALFDFTGTGFEVYGSTNAPKAVVQAAIIYCLRCLVGHDIPLNQGCMKPITIKLPDSCIINPSANAAVVGGNVLTSQRLVDVILGAFEACAASQGCMNNITFGDQSQGYYETVAGGAGAGPGWHGRSGVHTHMTNTRITDPEILEHRYPIILGSFGLRDGSGGRGRWNGGDGVVREYLFRKDLTLSVLTERRVFAPYGLKGGSPGQRGLNLVKYASGRTVNVGAKNSISVLPWDTFLLNTPGGGAWGKEEDSSEAASNDGDSSESKSFHSVKAAGSLHSYKQTQESA